MRSLIDHQKERDEMSKIASGREPQETPASAQTAVDGQYLDQLEAKLQMVRDRVTAVAKGYSTGLYLHGEGGVGKSFTVLQQLHDLSADFIPFNSRMSGRGLYDQLAKFPSSVHVLEDMEALFQDKGAQGVLRSALWAQRKKGAVGPLERLVTWTTHNEQSEFVFTGGIIIIANQPIDDVPVLRAVKSRIACLHLEVTAEELRALMRNVAAKGYEHRGIYLAPGACLEVCDYLIEQSLPLRRPLDMRLLINSFHDRIQWQEDDAACHWKDLVAARLRERPTFDCVNGGGRQAQLRREREIVREILAVTQESHEQIALWKERARKSQQAWYRRLAEVKRQASHSEKVGK
jgi:hypothetical protein